MFNPWLILAVVLAIGGAGISGYFKGSTDAKNAAAAAAATQMEAAIKQHNADAVIDMQAAYERGQAEAKVRVITRTIQGEASAITASAPIPVNCRLDAPRMKLLIRSIDVANGDKIDAPPNK